MAGKKSKGKGKQKQKKNSRGNVNLILEYYHLTCEAKGMGNEAGGSSSHGPKWRSTKGELEEKLVGLKKQIMKIKRLIVTENENFDIIADVLKELKSSAGIYAAPSVDTEMKKGMEEICRSKKLQYRG